MRRAGLAAASECHGVFRRSEAGHDTRSQPQRTQGLRIGRSPRRFSDQPLSPVLAVAAYIHEYEVAAHKLKLRGFFQARLIGGEKMARTILLLAVASAALSAGVAYGGVGTRDVYTDGASTMGPRDPYTDGGLTSKFDVFSDGARATDKRDMFLDGARITDRRDAFTDGA